MVGNGQTIGYSHYRSDDPNNPNSLVVPPNTAHVLKIYTSAHANIDLLCDISGITPDNKDEMQNMHKILNHYATPELLNNIRDLENQFKMIK